MGGENRRFPRLPFLVEVELCSLDGRKTLAETRDLGHGGVLLAMDGLGLEVNSEFTLRIAGELGDGVEPPLVKARVVRIDGEGVAVQFLGVPSGIPDEELLN